MITKIIEIQSGDNTQNQLQEIKPQSFNTMNTTKRTSAKPKPVLPLPLFLLIYIISFLLSYIYIITKFLIKINKRKCGFVHILPANAASRLS